MKRSTWLILAAIAALGCLTAATALAVAARERDKQHQARQDRAARAATVLLRATDQTVQGLRGLGTLAADSGTPAPSAFHRLGAVLLRQREVWGFTAIFRVPRSDRAAFERRLGRPITAADAGGRLVPEGARADYFPVTLSSMRPGSKSPLGFDVSSEPIRAAALAGAAAAEQPRSSPPLTLATSRRPGIVIYDPVYRPGAATRTASERTAALTGFIAGVYDTAQLLAAVEPQLPAGTELAVSDAGGQLGPRATLPPHAANRTIEVAGRRWRLTVGGPTAGASSLPVAIAIAGGALTMLVALLFLAAGRRERYALARVRERMVERDRAEAALREAEERFRGAFESAPIGIALVGFEGRMNGRVLKVNAALCRLLGYPADQLEGASLLEITHPEDLEIGRDQLTAVLESGESTMSFETRYLHASGHAIWVAIHARLLRDADGAPSHFISMVEDVTDRRDFERKLRYMADHDPLTGMFNRRRFEEEVGRRVAHTKRYGGGGAVLILDLDHFKYINDSLGHRLGDELIVAVAKLLQGHLRETDTLARLGGDEFAVLLPHADGSEAQLVAGKVLRVIRGEAVAIGRRKRRLTASMGIALLDPAGAVTADDLLVNADLALYDAKESGRDAVRLFADEQQEEARMRARVSWVERIQNALEQDGFVLYAQPILDLRTHTVAGHELLLRMRGDDGDLIPPAAFLQVAERYGLVNEIDRWVVRRAIELIGEARERGRERQLEVNISGVSLGDKELLELIECELARTEIDPRNIIFEVTETAAVSNIVAAREFAERVCALGCRFALDDFGAGYGSFYYLKHLPFDFVKIDGEFVRNCAKNKTDQLVVQAVVQIAKGLGKETIAEFVEDEATVTVLERFGVDYAQGYHVGRPGPLTDQLVEAEATAG